MSTITESIGRVLAGRYRVETALGSGASANVFAAFDTTLQRRVAVKVLYPALAADSAFLRRFRAEAQSAAALAHAHVLAVHDWGEDEQGPFLVLEFLAGGSLRDMLDEGERLSVPQAVEVGRQAAEGLAYAHSRGFVHRDVKPANLLFDEEGRLRIADFGLARALAEAALTEPAGMTVGTARYVAPEQALGHRLDGRADVYSLALVLYEAVTGVVPFSADTTLATLMARVDADIPGHDALGPLEEVLRQATTRHPADRLDAATFAARLRELAGGLPEPSPLRLARSGGDAILARPAPAPARDVDLTAHGMMTAPPATGRRVRGGKDPDVLAVAAAVGVSDDDAAIRRHRRRWPWIAALVVVAAGLAAVGTGFALVKTKLLVPSHKLPVITGLSETQAALVLARDKFHLRIVGHQTSITAPPGQVLHQIPAPGTKLKESSTVSGIVSDGLPTVAVPSLTTVTGDCPAVNAALAQANLKAACTDTNNLTVPKGGVISWNPQGSALYGSTITVSVSAGPPMEAIPSLADEGCQGATTTLAAVGLKANCTQAYNATVPTGQVVSWIPQGQALEGTTVNIVISEGPQPVTIPSTLYQMTVSEAIGALQALNLTPVSGGGPLSGHVFLSNPPAGASVLPGTSVTLYSR
jgi:eukaryotic-like serine/threonine-protein kinase